MQYLKGGDVLSAVKKKCAPTAHTPSHPSPILPHTHRPHRHRPRPRGKYTESDARTIFVPVLEGLRYLHDEANIIHRDLKLENILLEDAEDLGSVKIADFGLAKAIQETGDGAPGPHPPASRLPRPLCVCLPTGPPGGRRALSRSWRHVCGEQPSRLA